MKIRIATRKSPLALWQVQHVHQCLKQQHPDLSVEYIEMITEGDRFLNKPLSDIGGKGLFINTLEESLLEGRADLAVHSMKDLPATLPDGLTIACMLGRDDPRDILISAQQLHLQELPKKAIVGSSSLRRQAQLKHLRPDLLVQPLRGNVGTRLKKLQNNAYDAIILAVAGIKRLGQTMQIGHCFSINDMIPAAGQAVIAIECRADDRKLLDCLKTLNHAPTQQCVVAERAVNKTLGGGCHLPVAAYAKIVKQNLHLQAMVASSDGQQMIRYAAQSACPLHQTKTAQALGIMVGEHLYNAGGKELLSSS